MIRREQHEAESMERLSAEYLTLAIEAQGERFDALLARSGLSDDDLAALADSATRGPLFAALRDAEARGLDVDDALPRLVAGRSLADAADVASVLHGRVDRWAHAAGGRRRQTEHLIAGLIPRAQGVSDPDMARALAERDHAMEQRARSLAHEAIAAGLRLATAPRGPAERDRPSGSAGCEKCRPSRPTGTAGTSRVKAPSARHRIGRTTNRPPSARRRCRQGTGRGRSAPPQWTSRTIKAWSHRSRFRGGSSCEGISRRVLPAP